MKHSKPRTTLELKQFLVTQLMTPAQCAEFLQVSVDTLYVWVSNRKIPFRKAGGALRFDFDEVNEWSKQNRDERKTI